MTNNLIKKPKSSINDDYYNVVMKCPTKFKNALNCTSHTDEECLECPVEKCNKDLIAIKTNQSNK